MKKKNTFLDFTPLLDVTLILLFFFIIFANFEVGEKQQQLKNKISEYETLTADAKNLNKELKENLSILNREEASAKEAVMDFNSSLNIKLILDTDKSSPLLRVLKGRELLSSCQSYEGIEEALNVAMEKSGYTEEDTIFCDFIYDGDQSGTKYPQRKIEAVINSIKGSYKYFYCSRTDISSGRD